MLKSSGKLKLFNKWVLLECDRSIAQYYCSLYSMEYFYKPKIQIPLWGAHISVVRGEILLSQFKDEIQGMEIEFYYVNTMFTNGVHFWLPVICPILDDIRELFGLGRGYVNYHLSIGNIANGTGETPPEVFI